MRSVHRVAHRAVQSFGPTAPRSDHRRRRPFCNMSGASDAVTVTATGSRPGYGDSMQEYQQHWEERWTAGIDPGTVRWSASTLLFISWIFSCRVSASSCRPACSGGALEHPQMRPRWARSQWPYTACGLETSAGKHRNCFLTYSLLQHWDAERSAPSLCKLLAGDAGLVSGKTVVVPGCGCDTSPYQMFVLCKAAALLYQDSSQYFWCCTCHHGAYCILCVACNSAQARSNLPKLCTVVCCRLSLIHI